MPRTKEEERLLKSRTIRDRVPREQIDKPNRLTIESPLKNVSRQEIKPQEIKTQDYALPQEVRYKSKLEQILDELELSFREVRPLIERNEATKTSLTEMISSANYTEKEINAYREQYNYNRTIIVNSTQDIQVKLNKAKQLWIEKQADMRIKYESGLVDIKTSQIWSQSLKESQEVLERYSTLLNVPGL